MEDLSLSDATYVGQFYFAHGQFTTHGKSFSVPTLADRFRVLHMSQMRHPLQEPWCQSMPNSDSCAVQAFDAQRGKGNNFWSPMSDGAGLAPAHPLLFFSRVLALEWIQLTAKHLLPPFGLQLHGEVWYQGMSADTFEYALLHAVSDTRWPTAYCCLQAGNRWTAADSMQMQLAK